MGHFGQSRIHPRVSSQSPKARSAIGKEISDLLKNEAGQPPALLRISSEAPQYRNMSRIPSTSVVKRKSSDLYKVRLCNRGDVVSLTVTSFMRSPTARRCGVKILRTISSHLRWHVRVLDISQDFLQSGNMRPEDRMSALPPTMAARPWAGHIPPQNTDLKAPAPSQHGFLLLRPIYGGRDAHVRCWVTLYKRLRAQGYRKLQCDVCRAPSTTPKESSLRLLYVASMPFYSPGPTPNSLSLKRYCALFALVKSKNLQHKHILSPLASLLGVLTWEIGIFSRRQVTMPKDFRRSTSRNPPKSERS